MNHTIHTSSRDAALVTYQRLLARGVTQLTRPIKTARGWVVMAFVPRRPTVA